jgi:hypothetical protein
MAQFAAPMVRDAAGRLLVGFLRAHDLVSVRHVPIDGADDELKTSLVPVSDAPLGGYEASRLVEIERWQAKLGQGPTSALRREVRAMSLHLLKEAMTRAEVLESLADAVVEAVSANAFADEAGLLEELTRLHNREGDFAAVMAEELSRIAGAGDDPGSLKAALAPLVEAVREDIGVAAQVIKQSSG